MRDPSKSITSKLVRIWNWLTEPSALVREPDQKRQARLLAVLFLMLLPLGIARAALPVLIDPTRGTAWQLLEFRVIALVSFFVFFAYALTRTRFYTIAAVGIIVLSSIAIFAAMIPLSSTAKFAGFYYLILPVLFASLFFSARLAFVVALIDLAGITLVPFFSPAVPVDDLYLGPFSFVAIMSIVVLLMTHYRNRVEQDRQAELAASESRYRTLAEAVPDAIFIINRQDRIEYINHFAARLMGKRPDELIGQARVQLFSSATSHQHSSSLTHVFETGQAFRAETLTEFPSGSIWLDTHLVPLKDAGGNISAVLGMARDVTERKRAEQDARRRAAQLESLRQIGLELTAELHLDALFQSIMHRAVELIDADGGGLYLYDPARDVIVCHIVVGRVLIPVGTVRARGESLSGKIFAAGKSLAVDDYAQIGAPGSVPPSASPVPVIGAPIFWSNEFLGVLTVGRNTPRAFHHSDIELLEMVASYAATAIRNARALEAEGRARRDAETLARSTASFATLGQRLNATTNAEQAARIILDVADSLLGWDACYLDRYSQEQDRVESILNIDTLNGQRVEYPNSTLVTKPTSTMRRILREGAQLVLRDNRAEFPALVPFGDTTRPSESLMFVPVRHGDDNIGILSIQSYTPNAYSQESIHLLQSLADHCGGALERLRVTEQIRASLAEKEILLKEVHHRVKNNLQIVSSLLNLQSAQIKDASMRDAFRDSQNRIRAMALIHERLYRADALARVDLGEYARSLSEHIFRAYGTATERIALEVNADAGLVGIDLAISCGLILNELVSNAVKHAFPNARRGAIHIEFRATGERQWMLSVRDDGVGLPAALDFRNTLSLGLQLVNILAKQINGTIEIKSQAGTEFTIRFAEPAPAQRGTQ